VSRVRRAVVLDTNVLLSGFVGLTKPESVPGELLRRWNGREFALIVSRPILDEFTRALTYPYFARQMTPRQCQIALRRLTRIATTVSITRTVSGVAPDADDDLILATALSGSADYLVTGDRALLSLGAFDTIPILTPRAFLDVLADRP